MKWTATAHASAALDFDLHDLGAGVIAGQQAPRCKVKRDLFERAPRARRIVLAAARRDKLVMDGGRAATAHALAKGQESAASINGRVASKAVVKVVLARRWRR